jgi:hypothetical protein
LQLENKKIFHTFDGAVVLPKIKNSSRMNTVGLLLLFVVNVFGLRETLIQQVDWKTPSPIKLVNSIPLMQGNSMVHLYAESDVVTDRVCLLSVDVGVHSCKDTRDFIGQDCDVWLLGKPHKEVIAAVAENVNGTLQLSIGSLVVGEDNDISWNVKK